MLEEELLSQICDNKENEEDDLPMDEGMDVSNNISNTLPKEGAEGSDMEPKETGHRHVRSRNSMSLENLKNGIDFEELNAMQSNERNLSDDAISDLSDSSPPNEVVQDID